MSVLSELTRMAGELLEFIVACGFCIFAILGILAPFAVAFEESRSLSNAGSRDASKGQNKAGEHNASNRLHLSRRQCSHKFFHERRDA